jgi:Type IV secretion-system coupling protein DNA-binding domain/Phage integrase family
MAEWGRKEYSKAWPSRTPVWTWGAIFLSLLFFAGMLTLQYEQSWTAAERLYLSDYLKSGARGKASPTSTGKYTLLEAVVGKGQRLVMGDEIEPVPGPDGRPGYRLTDEGVKDGIVRLTWVAGMFNDRGLHRVMSQAVYSDHQSWEFYRKPVWFTLAVFVLLLFVAVPKDRARRMIYKHGRRLRGPELVTTAELNEKLGKSKLLTTHLPDGVSFINEEQTWTDKLFRKNLSRWARVPRDREAMHFLIVGDSGTGKSAAIRQILAQVWERNEAAIVYDPAMEYLPQFYNEARGDVILNPMDARCPFWTPGDEVPHEAEALTLAASLFPDQGRENRFFVEAPRKIFAHLLNLIGKTGSAHLFRHTMATLMLEGGADIRFIQQMLGHVSLRTTEKYTHVSIRTLQKVYAATHPGANLERKQSASQDLDRDAVRAELLAALDAEVESEIEREDS